ncbi:26S proteasome non-ATPase regulatory subunit 12 [Salpingoeca rosetta]|uniref:26S proteasome non-ATPase regulatory subunit 12 n=1 Tax=Salpingoeca rosetta (strain ATCC 50818 / BSB-021) TaxID=946362 RepID=F2UHT8_SALR5|nr:26S proteasome non-ATPase regulatory subunit 12 [Salpingoeca rosetta]EGD76687.1 26S proteasome non-ATPase regulatory subunit 12 [Salpingoeca rosetta]|eukprot:XP_004991059.1 26S proteasome non-ATPase regulatory subunit 12 [Salpingoeca rosetta]
MAEDEGRIIKQEADYTEEVDASLPIASSLAQDGKLDEAIESLLPLEKKSRMAADMKSTSRILVHIVTMCFEQQAWDKMLENIVMLIKRRGQIKKAVTDMIRKVCEFIEQAPDKATKLKMLDTVRTITAGKIHVENERARLTRELARIKEEEGNIAEAADVLQELQVETYGTMERREKVEFILEQMRLCLAKHDYIRAQIISKKISTKFFKDESTHDLKLKYHRQMLQLAAHDRRYLDMCKHHRSIFDTPSVKADAEAAKKEFQSAVLYLVLAPYDNEQADLIARVSEDPVLEDLPEAQSLLSVFTTDEVRPWRVFETQFAPFLRSTDVFAATEQGEKQWSELRDRIIEHNIRVMAMYYTRMRTSRMAELLDLTEKDAEKYLSRLVTLKTVYAKIDRPARVIVFKPKPKANQVLNDWGSGLSHLMSLVDKATHLIQKERMVHQV